MSVQFSIFTENIYRNRNRYGIDVLTPEYRLENGGGVTFIALQNTIRLGLKVSFDTS